MAANDSTDNGTTADRQKREALSASRFPPIEGVTRPVLDTAAAAHYLNRAPQTLRIWASRDGSGPIQPTRINGRLAWPVSEIKRVLGVS